MLLNIQIMLKNVHENFQEDYGECSRRYINIYDIYDMFLKSEMFKSLTLPLPCYYYYCYYYHCYYFYCYYHYYYYLYHDCHCG